ncbi:type IV toxin-antitoxin system AbiEi family antitoxin domain-containing protein [Arthrobacter oryzae]|uniref:type IV toxin-antitoxin system AbiEi family antitoxin domain-containing protein n=1 Tax=Arthrobacter oryzae TaxID=409290 RepID=UPI00273B891C|nr:type IV toxin-antitoxin system AbiEi family antitoxin domain-containing protein [Arthrobacter oryzae]WLQ07052.1 type IV toxin-antitoxin system AbiEi family antitoxin domain-containing protein [Arthrobacter oryzae]
MPDFPILLLARDCGLHGLTAKDLAKRVRSGALVRIRHGVYADGAAWRELKDWQKYRLQVRAAGEMFEKPTIFARHSAASVWGVPTIGVSHPVQALTLTNDGGRSRAVVRRHFAAPSGLEVVRREGLLVTSRLRTVLDLAAFTPFAEAVVPLDHVLRPGAAAQLPALSKDDIRAGMGSIYSTTRQRRILAALDFADARSASAGESYSRSLLHLAGFEAPVLQQEFRDEQGLIGYADFYWKRARVVGEFDGEEKYLKPEYLRGRTPSQVVVEEKYREDRIRAIGFTVVRWVWADLMQPGRLERKLAAGGVPRRRARSADFDARNVP